MFSLEHGFLLFLCSPWLQGLKYVSLKTLKVVNKPVLAKSLTLTFKVVVLRVFLLDF